MNRARAELGFVVLTGLGHFVFQVLLPLGGPYVVVAVVGWAAYITWRLRSPGQARAWGIRGDNLGQALRHNGAFVAVGAAAIALYALARGTLTPPPASFYLLLVLYPAWGFVQQFMMCALVYSNGAKVARSKNAAHALATILFGLVHIPEWRLCALTTIACAVWMAFYRRAPNLWAQGLSHGILAVLAYRYVLERDPLAEIARSLGF